MNSFKYVCPAKCYSEGTVISVDGVLLIVKENEGKRHYEILLSPHEEANVTKNIIKALRDIVECDEDDVTLMKLRIQTIINVVESDE